MLLRHPRARDDAPSGEAPSPPPSAPPLAAEPGLSRHNWKLFAFGGIVTLLWLNAAMLYVVHTTGWAAVAALSLPELGAALAGVTGPLAFLWLLLAYFSRGRELRQNADALHRLLMELSFPTPETELRIQQLTGALRRHTQELDENAARAAEKLTTLQEAGARQAQALQEAADMLVRQTEAAERAEHRLNLSGDMLRRHAETLTAVADAAESRLSSSSAAARHVAQSLGALVDGVSNRAERVGGALRGHGEAFEGAADRFVTRTEQAAESMTAKVRD